VTTKRYKVLLGEIDGVELDDHQEFALDTSDALLSFAGLTTIATTTTVTSSTLQLTLTSNAYQVFTGTTSGQIMRMPDATTLVSNRIFEAWNFSTKQLVIQDFAGTVLTTLKANAQTTIFLRDGSTTAGVWALTYTLDSGNSFGSQATYNEDNTETSNTSTSTWLNKVTLTLPSTTPLGDYLLYYQFQWRTSANRNLDVRIQRNGSVVLDNWQPYINNVSERPLLTGFARSLNISGVTTFTLDFRVGPLGASAVYMSQARLLAWRIA
jgi:hypothetical protein